jgi:hypothetical protein
MLRKSCTVCRVGQLRDLTGRPRRVRLDLPARCRHGAGARRMRTSVDACCDLYVGVLCQKSVVGLSCGAAIIEAEQPTEPFVAIDRRVAVRRSRRRFGWRE